jgi:hypothetical protein
MRSNKMNIFEDLFLSKKRQLVDIELRRIADTFISNPQLRDNILYHLCFVNLRKFNIINIIVLFFLYINYF